MEINKAIILIAGKAKRLEDDAFLSIILTKSLFITRRVPDEETILLREIKILKELGIKEIYIVVAKEAGERVREYIEKTKAEEKNEIKIKVVEQKFMETGNRVLQLKQKIKDEAFLICYGDEVFDGKLNEEFNFFLEKSKEIIKNNNNAALIRALIKPENYKGGVATLEEQTKCKVEGNKIFWATKKEFIPRGGEGVLLFTSFMVATPKIFEIIENFQKETGKEQISLHDLEFTNFLIKKEVLYGIEVQLNYFNINRKEDKQKMYEYFTIRDFETLKTKKDYKLLSL
jgi:NDP-sugar pyrophosphorylase family protein